MTHPSCRLALLACLAFAAADPLWAAVEVQEGPTSIPDGEATAAHDLTIRNEKLAFALAVESAAPYGVPRGAIVDLAPVVDGQPAKDRVVFADFIPNNWSAWPNTYQRVKVLKRGPQQVVVQAVRDWGDVTIDTTYTLRSESDRIELRTVMTNTGKRPLTGLLSGQTLWPSAGYYFGIPGLGDLQEGPATGALADRASAYDADWSITLHAPYLDYVGSRSKDLFVKHDLAPGESRTFDAWLQVGPRGDLGPVVAAEIERRKLPSGHVQGSVRTREGQPVATPVVVFYRQGAPYTWSVGHDGRFDVALPTGEYQAYATAQGYSQTASVPVTVASGAAVTQDFADLEPPGRVSFDVTDAKSGRGVDARIVITQGQKPLVEYLGRSTFFTELDRLGHYDVEMAPGQYSFKVTSGGVFFGPSQMLDLTVKPGTPVEAQVQLARLFDPRTSGWYGADLHHHADQAEGVTPAEHLARSQLAAGLDFLFVSDHDSTANHAKLQAIADRRGVPFIASMEISPSWGHFNAWPLSPQGQKLAIDTSTATIHQVLAEARRQGAIVVQSNHPFIPYGYLASLAAGVVPGGFNPALDLFEINADVPTDHDKVAHALWQFWNAGHRYYLSGGTDVHDVWNHESGTARLFAHLDGAPTPVAFAEAAKAGHAYVSFGPLIQPGVMFGSDLKVSSGTTISLPFDLQSVTGLQQATLIGGGQVVATRSFDNAPNTAHVEFRVSPAARTWYAIEVEDVGGRKAYSNPIWVDVVENPAAATTH